MPITDSQNTPPAGSDGHSTATGSVAKDSTDKLLSELREINSLGTFRTDTTAVTQAFNASRPAAPDGTTASDNSYLDLAVHKAVDPITHGLGGSQAVADEATFYAKSFIKTAPLFMDSKVAAASLALLYMADEAKPNESIQSQVEDAGLGLAKGALLNGTLKYMRESNFTPSLTAIGLSISNRTIETGLTRSNYYDQQNQFSLGHGLWETAKTTFNPVSLSMDTAAMIATDGLWGRIYSKTKGRAVFNPLVTNTLSAGTFGALSGMESETYKELKDGHIDLAMIAKRTAEQGGINALAGAVGGEHMRQSERIGRAEAREAIENARNTPYQRGESGLDQRQIDLRDGTFVPQSNGFLVHTPTFFGHVELPSGERIPSVFRPHTGGEDFAHRMQSEIANYDLNDMIKFSNKSPATVARDVEINGTNMSGYIQEVRGNNLLQFMRTESMETQGGKSYAAMTRTLRENPQLMSAFKESFAERMVMGEWDNHAQNLTVTKSDSGVEMPNIDMGFGLRPALSVRDLQPNPGLRTGWEGLNWKLYNEISGKPIGAELQQKMSDFVSTSETAEGQARLHNMGLTDAQIKGVVGRAKWFADNGTFPSEPNSLTYFGLAYALKGRKF